MPAITRLINSRRSFRSGKKNSLKTARSGSKGSRGCDHFLIPAALTVAAVYLLWLRAIALALRGPPAMSRNETEAAGVDVQRMSCLLVALGVTRSQVPLCK